MNRNTKSICSGVTELKEGKVTRGDLVATGLLRGAAAHPRDAPKGDFPRTIAFRLAAASVLADGIPPQRSREWLDAYLK